MGGQIKYKFDTGDWLMVAFVVFMLIGGIISAVHDYKIIKYWTCTYNQYEYRKNN